MAELAQRETSSIGTVAGNILKDSEKLVRQELDLFEAKIKRDVNEKIASGIYVVVGSVFFFAALVCAVITLVNLGTALQLPLWASYGLTAIVCALFGGITLIVANRREKLLSGGDYGRQRKEN